MSYWYVRHSILARVQNGIGRETGIENKGRKTSEECVMMTQEKDEGLNNCNVKIEKSFGQAERMGSFNSPHYLQHKPPLSHPSPKIII